MNTTRLEGIVLQVVKYGEQDLIITVFSAERGLLRMFVKRGLSQRGKNRLPMEPLTQAEFVYATTGGELLQCREVTVQDQFRFLRDSYSLLEAAFQMVDTILKSQGPEVPAPAIYAVFCLYLKRLKEFSDPLVAVSSLRLKILRYEGLFSTENLPSDFDEEQQQLTLVLAYSRSFATLCQMVGTSNVHAKIEKWMKNLLSQ